MSLTFVQTGVEAPGAQTMLRELNETLMGILNYAKEMESELLRAKPDRVFVTHPPCDQAVVDAVCSYLKGLGHFKEVLDTEAGGVISSHCGPGTLGVLYIEGE